MSTDAENRARAILLPGEVLEKVEPRSAPIDYTNFSENPFAVTPTSITELQQNLTNTSVQSKMESFSYAPLVTEGSYFILASTPSDLVRSVDSLRVDVYYEEGQIVCPTETVEINSTTFDFVYDDFWGRLDCTINTFSILRASRPIAAINFYYKVETDLNRYLIA